MTSVDVDLNPDVDLSLSYMFTVIVIMGAPCVGGKYIHIHNKQKN